MGHDLGFVCRVALMTLFGVSAASKARPVNVSIFALSLARFGVAPRARRPVARGVVALEVLLVLLLLLPPTVRAAGAVAAVVLTGFTLALLGRLRSGDTAPCHCFGAGAAKLGPASIVRNLAAIAAGLLVAVLGAWPGWSPTAPLAIAGLAVGAALILSDSLAALLTPPELTRP